MLLSLCSFHKNSTVWTDIIFCVSGGFRPRCMCNFIDISDEIESILKQFLWAPNSYTGEGKLYTVFFFFVIFLLFDVLCRNDDLYLIKLFDVDSSSRL